MNKIAFIVKCLTSKYKRVINNTVFFDSFLGQYNDNPKYISEALHEMAPDVQIVWSQSEKSHIRFPDYVKTVPYGSREFYFYAFNSQVVIDNHMGIRTLGFRRKKNRLFNYIVRRPGQLAISTWHGTPLKKIGKDQLHRDAGDFCTSIKYCVASSSFAKETIGDAFFVRDKMRNYGTPRNDVFFKSYTLEQIENLKRRLKLPIDKKLILFAPTFRDSVELSGISQLKEININRLLEVLKNRFGDEFAFVFRAHHTVLMAIEDNRDLAPLKSLFIDGNIGDDMAEYLLCTDILLTDYSSVFFDYIYTRKPIFLYAPDIKSYTSLERGIYMDYDNLPFLKSVSVDGLYKNIENFDEQLYNSKLDKFLISLGNYETGTASEKVVSDILEFIKSPKFQ